MAPRLELHQLLKSITNNVYFQPPTNVQLVYPCIIYKRDFADTKFADDKPYSFMWRYMLTVIDKNPDGGIPDKISELPRTSFVRFYTADNLNHDVFTLYF